MHFAADRLEQKRGLMLLEKEGNSCGEGGKKGHRVHEFAESHRTASATLLFKRH